MGGHKKQLQELGLSPLRAESCPERLTGMLEDMVIRSPKSSQEIDDSFETQLHGSDTQFAASSLRGNGKGKAAASTAVYSGSESPQAPATQGLISTRDAQSCYPPEASIFIANLAKEPSDEELLEALRGLFNQYGKCWVILRRDIRKRNIPFAFVQYRTPEEAEDAMYHATGEMILGRPCRVEASRAHRAVYLTRKDNRCPSSQEVSSLFEGFDIHETWSPSPTELEKHGLGNGVWVRFKFYGACQEALKQFRGHPTYHLLYKDFSRGNRSRNTRARMEPSWSAANGVPAGPSYPYMPVPVTQPPSTTAGDLTPGMVYAVNPLPTIPIIQTTPGHFSQSHSSQYAAPVIAPHGGWHSMYQTPDPFRTPQYDMHLYTPIVPGAPGPGQLAEVPCWAAAFPRVDNQLSPTRYAPQELDFRYMPFRFGVGPAPSSVPAPQFHLPQPAVPSNGYPPPPHDHGYDPFGPVMHSPPVNGGDVSTYGPDQTETQFGPPAHHAPVGTARANRGRSLSTAQSDGAYASMDSSLSSAVTPEAHDDVPMTPMSSHI